MNKKLENLIKDLANEIDILNNMLTSLVEILEAKGILKQEEWENKIKEKIDKKTKRTSFRDIQLDKTH